MPVFVVDLWLDGYDNEEEMEAACEEFIEEQLNFSASYVDSVKIKEKEAVDALCYILGKNPEMEHAKEIKELIKKLMGVK